MGGIRINRRGFLAAMAGGGVGSMAFPYTITRARAAAKNQLVFVGFGGSYQEAQTKALFEPFERESGIKIVQTTGVDLAKLRAQVRSRNVEWDMLLIPDRQRYTAVKDDLLTPLNYNIIDARDIPREAVTNWSVGGLSIPMILTFSTKAYPTGRPQPRTWADFWDGKKFPGTRGLYNSPNYSLEFALLADGVPKEKLYPLDVARAFRSLDRLKAENKVVWWIQFPQPGVLFKSGEIAMTYWTRSVSFMLEGEPLGISYDGGALPYSSWVVPNGAPNAEGAMKFINFALKPKPQADLTNLTAFSPTNAKAMQFVGDKLKPLLATEPENKKKTFPINAEWWGQNLDKVTEQWNEWRLK